MEDDRCSLLASAAPGMRCLCVCEEKSAACQLAALKRKQASQGEVSIFIAKDSTSGSRNASLKCKGNLAQIDSTSDFWCNYYINH
eukprot:3508430-Amphidinium_carterae.1